MLPHRHGFPSFLTSTRSSYPKKVPHIMERTFFYRRTPLSDLCDSHVVVTWCTRNQEKCVIEEHNLMLLSWVPVFSVLLPVPLSHGYVITLPGRLSLLQNDPPHGTHQCCVISKSWFEIDQSMLVTTQPPFKGATSMCEECQCCDTMWTLNLAVSEQVVTSYGWKKCHRQ